MKNRLFIVCPFSNLELFLSRKYGRNVYFISAPGGVAFFNEIEHLLAIKEFIEENKISSIYIVNEISCPFISKVVNRDSSLYYRWENVMEEIFQSNYYEYFKNFSVDEQKYNLASLNIRNFAKELFDSDFFKNIIFEKNINVRGIVTSKNDNQLQDVNVYHLNRNSYEF